MTGVTGTEDARLRAQAELLLAELCKGDPDRRRHVERPDGAHLVADALHTLGLLEHGHRNRCFTCPVALYLWHTTGHRWSVYQTCATVKFSVGAKTLEHALVQLPAPVAAFVHAFDGGGGQGAEQARKALALAEMGG